MRTSQKGLTIGLASIVGIFRGFSRGMFAFPPLGGMAHQPSLAERGPRAARLKEVTGIEAKMLSQGADVGFGVTK